MKPHLTSPYALGLIALTAALALAAAASVGLAPVQRAEMPDVAALWRGR